MILNPCTVLRPAALKFANHTALINIERNRRYTYREVHEILNKMCNMLRDKFGLGEGDKFATLLENDHMYFAYLFALRSQSTSVWLSIRDSIEDHLYQIDYVKPSLIFLEYNLIERYYKYLLERNIIIICMDNPENKMENVYGFWDLMDESSSNDPSFQVTSDDARKHTCLLKFTGGTTGLGKCAMYSLSNFLSAGTNLSYSDVFPHDNPKVLLSTPITHAAGSMIIPAYFKGGTVITLNRADIESFCQVIEKEKVELIYTVPTVLYRMVDMQITERYDLSSLQTIRYGASPISDAKLEELIKQFGRIFIQGYAATESWVPGTILKKDEHDLSTETSKKRLKSIGSPVPGMEFKIADSEGNEMPIGEEGEIWIRGPHNVIGYYKDDDQTKENFTDDGFWKSGDIGYMDDANFLYLVDRKKDMIVSGGFNVYANEVEKCINGHPAVQQSAVVGIPHDYWGEAVHAEVILNENANISEVDLIDYCKQRIARYKSPKSIKFVDSLPLSSVGKVLRRVVKEKYKGNKDRRIY